MITAGAENLEHISSAFLAEALAMFYAVNICVEMSCDHVIFRNRFCASGPEAGNI
jgi:hypothetical protein